MAVDKMKVNLLTESSAIDRLNAKFDDLVPSTGKAKTVAGEIVRAVTRIGYRYLNDGDQIGVDYGRETCNAPARYIVDVVRDSKVIRQIDSMWGTFYRESEINKLAQYVMDYLDKHPELETKRNTADMWSYYDPKEDRDYDDEDEEGW